MNALITGAAGFLGAALARRLASRGDSVTCLVRERGSPPDPAPVGPPAAGASDRESPWGAPPGPSGG